MPEVTTLNLAVFYPNDFQTQDYRSLKFNLKLKYVNLKREPWKENVTFVMVTLTTLLTLELELRLTQGLTRLTWLKYQSIFFPLAVYFTRKFLLLNYDFRGNTAIWLLGNDYVIALKEIRTTLLWTLKILP